MPAILARNDQPDAGGDGVAERHRRAGFGFSLRLLGCWNYSDVKGAVNHHWRRMSAPVSVVVFRTGLDVAGVCTLPV